MKDRWSSNQGMLELQHKAKGVTCEDNCCICPRRWGLLPQLTFRCGHVCRESSLLSTTPRPPCSSSLIREQPLIASKLK